jgi:hypothetical protein
MTVPAPPPLRERLLYGSRFVDVDLPAGTLVVPAPPPLPALPDVAAATRAALESPLGMRPLSELVGAGSKVLVAFDDPAVFTGMRPDPRSEVVPAVLASLAEAGVNLRDVTLICANALHRKWTRRELGGLLGPQFELAWPLHRLINHDACAPDELVDLGESPRGLEVEVSRRVLESDLTLYVSIPITPMNGGWKSVAVGLSGFRSIRHHHRPFPSSGQSIMDPHRSAFHKILRELGRIIDAEVKRRGHHLMQLEVVLSSGTHGAVAAAAGAGGDGPPGIGRAVAGIFAGDTEAVHARALELLERQQVVDVAEPVDVLVIGLPDTDPYSQHARINPILLTNLGCSYTFGLYQRRPLLREGGVLVLVTPMHHDFDDIHHPSYREFYTSVLARTLDPFEAWDTFVDDFAHRPDYVHRYRHAYGFHGSHPFFMWNSTGFVRRHARAILVAGAVDEAVPRHLGFDPVASVDSALVRARELLGSAAGALRVGVLPLDPVRITRVGA